MKAVKCVLIALVVLVLMMSVLLFGQRKEPSTVNIVFLHHSTGSIIWQGEKPPLVARAANKLSSRLGDRLGGKACLPKLFDQYNRSTHKRYGISEVAFPKASPYGWHNYPYDYYNIWVKNAGDSSFMEEPTLEMLTPHYQVIVFKHCYPVCNIGSDTNPPEIDSDRKSLANYKLQYLALRDKCHEFSSTRFIVLTGAAQVKACISEEEAGRAREFFRWVVEEWDLPKDNIFVWDLYQLQTEGGLYFKDGYATAIDNSHPNTDFAAKVAPLLFNRIIDVVENDGAGTTVTGERKE